MQKITVTQITAKLHELPEEKLSSVYDYISFLAKKSSRTRGKKTLNVSSIQTMIASEKALKEAWDSPEEDEAWADL